MGAFIVRRLLGAVVVVVIVIMLVFILVNAVGDPAASTLGPNAGPDQIAAFQRKHGLDRPLYSQMTSYLGFGQCVRGRRAGAIEDTVAGGLGNADKQVWREHRGEGRQGVRTGEAHRPQPDRVAGSLEPDGDRWRLTVVVNPGTAGRTEIVARGNVDALGRDVMPQLLAALSADEVSMSRFERTDRCGILQGDLGESFAHNESVTGVIGHRLPRTLLLGAIALIFELILGLSIGIIAAVKRNTWVDTGLLSVAYLGISLPTFVIGPIFLAVFGFAYGWFPLGGYGVSFWDHVYHAILPALTMAVVGAATYARIMRSELVDTLRSDFIRTAAAKGLPRSGVLRHAIRNALLAIVTMIGLSLPLLVAGAIITEKIFGWPGMGSLALGSITNLDTPSVMGVVLVFAVTVQVGNILADIAVAYLDPRVRIDQSG